MADTRLFIDFMVLTFSCLFFVVFLARGVRSRDARMLALAAGALIFAFLSSNLILLEFIKIGAVLDKP